MLNFKEIISDKKFLFLVYGMLIILSCLGFKSKLYIPFYLAFAFFIGWLWFFEKERISTNRQQMGTNHEWSKWLIIIPLIIILATRIIPFLSSEAPLGYDTGIYKKNIENFSTALPNLPQFPEGAWGRGEPWGLYLSTDLLSLAGFSDNQILYGYYILLNLLLALSIYAVVKRFFNQNAAILAVFIFALSLTQFQTYWMMYYKNIAGLFLMLMAFWLLRQKSWLIIPLAGFLGGLHRPTFLVFGLAMLSYYTYESFANKNEYNANEDKPNMNRIYRLLAWVWRRLVSYTFVAGLGILAVAFSLYLHNLRAIFQFLSPNLGEMLRTFGPGAGAGTFFNFEFYRQIITFYFPFAVLGLIYLIKKRQFNYLFFWFVINFSIVYFNFIFHNRFIIHFDIIVIVLAGLGASFILGKFFTTLTGKVAIFILLIGAVYVLGTVVLNKKPLISREELAKIKSLSGIAKEDEYVMATDSYYSPWVYGYSERKTIAPGLFEYNKWNLLGWQTFWSTPNLELRHQLLDEYQGPIFIFVGDKQHSMDFSDDPRFQRISKRIWKYE